MSIRALNWAFAQTDLKSTQKFVLVALADNADDYGICWPSYNTIAEKCSLSRRAVINAIKALEQNGTITKTERYRKNGFNNSNAFLLNLGVEITEDHPLKGVVNEMHPMVNEMHPKGERDAPKPSLNHHLTERERDALTREEFLRFIDKGYSTGSFAETFPHLTETEIKHQAEECFDRWGDNLRGRDPVVILRTWIRKGIEIGTVRKQPKETNASKGREYQEPENELQPWHERIQQHVSEGDFKAWFRAVVYDGKGTLIAPTRFHANWLKQNYSQVLSMVIKDVQITYNTTNHQTEKEMENA